MLHDDNLAVIPTFPTWVSWLRASGVEAASSLPGHRFDSSSMVLDATLEGQGVSLDRSALGEHDLRNGRLIRLFDHDFPVTHDYFMIYPETSPCLRKIETLQRWLMEEARKSTATTEPLRQGMSA